MNKAIVLGAALTVIGATGCSDVDNAYLDNYSKPHIVKQYANGILVGQWEAVGEVQNDGHNNSYMFIDTKTRQLITVSGTVQITLK